MDHLSHTVIKWRSRNHKLLLSRNGDVLCPIAPLIHSRLYAVVGRSGWQFTWCVASINSTAIRYNVSYKYNP